jgi:hypothetical protein
MLWFGHIMRLLLLRCYLETLVRLVHSLGAECCFFVSLGDETSLTLVWRLARRWDFSDGFKTKFAEGTIHAIPEEVFGA